MKAFNVQYSHGHFIDVETNKRIIPVQGEKYIISANESAFTTEDIKLKIGKPLSESEKAVWAINKYGVNNFKLILKAGEQIGSAHV